MKSVNSSRWRAGSVVVGLLVGLLILAAAAPAAHPVNVYVGQLYQGSLGRPTFRISGHGRTMQFRGRTAFTERCYLNGRFAGRFEVLVVQSKARGNTLFIPAPLVTIRPNGTFYGAGSHSFKPRAASRETLHYHFSGHFTGKGRRTAVGRFFANNCSKPAVPCRTRGAAPVVGRHHLGRPVRDGCRVCV